MQTIKYYREERFHPKKILFLADKSEQTHTKNIELDTNQNRHTLGVATQYDCEG